MRRLAAAVLSLVATFCVQTFAEADSAAIAAGATAGATAGMRQPPPVQRELPGSELDDWRDSRTGTTTHLVHRCGHTIEARLSGTSGANFLTLAIVNQGRVPSTFSPLWVVATFDDGPERRLEPLDAEAALLEPEWWGKWSLRFPEKTDFRNTDAIFVRLSLSIAGREQPCEITIPMRRDPTVAERQETFTDHTAFELYLETGSRVRASGGQRTLSGHDGFTLGIGFGGFFSVHHGLFGELALERYGEEDLSVLGPRLTVLDEDRLGSAALWGGYTARLYLGRWIVANYALAAAPYLISLSDNEPATPSTEIVYFALRQRLRFDVAFGRISDGTWFGLGLGVLHHFIPDGSFGAADASGHALSVTGAFIVAM